MSKEKLSKGPLRRRKPRNEMYENGTRPLTEIKKEIEGLIAVVSGRTETTGHGRLENRETIGRIRELADQLPRAAERARVLQRIKET